MEKNYIQDLRDKFLEIDMPGIASLIDYLADGVVDISMMTISEELFKFKQFEVILFGLFKSHFCENQDQTMLQHIENALPNLSNMDKKYRKKTDDIIKEFVSFSIEIRNRISKLH
mgnify:CR=1 FL=1